MTENSGESQRTEKSVPCRMDFVIEKSHIDDESRMAYFMIIPHPKRYSETQHEGKPYFLDKFLHHLIPMDEMMSKLSEKANQLPLFDLSPSIKSSHKYAEERRDALSSELKGGQYIKPEQPAVPHAQIEFPSSTKLISFISVDICSGSALRRQNKDAFEKSYAIFIRELGTIVGQFNGRILKPTGDGFIAYIDHPCFTRQADNIIDMGLTFLKVLHESINVTLDENGLPNLDIRIGADFGEATFREINIPATGFSETEIASDALNHAVKIQEISDANTLCFGRQLYEVLHVDWLERAKEIEIEANDLNFGNYKVYSVI